jgi:nucleotide-binding universal stress UspA family protein
MPQFTEMHRPELWRDRRREAHGAGADRRSLDPRIVVLGYDGSRAARRALLRAAEAAGNRGRVIVVAAVAPAATSAPEHGIDPPIADPEHVLEEATALLGGHDVEVATRLAQAEPADALVATASETDAALIVVGARGDSYPARALRGSVAETLVARAPCDLLIAR